jgi:hypothetical protein
MPLDNLEPTDTFDIIESKLDAAIDKVNEIDANLGGGTSSQKLAKASGSNYDYEWVSDDVKDANDQTWSGTQGVTGSYADLGTITYTTPNDGITRNYLILLDALFTITSATGDNQVNLQLYNSTTTTAIRALEGVAFPDVDPSETARILGSIKYYGAIPPNTTMVARVMKTTSNGINAVNATMIVIEQSR